jgi:hypothetical protein
MVVMQLPQPEDELVPMGLVAGGKPTRPERKATVRVGRILESDRFVLGTCQRRWAAVQ